MIVDSGWALYWEGMPHRHIFEVEARDHVTRLRRAIPIGGTDRVLDFGCGFGHVTALLAASVASVGFWDAAAAMREATARRTAALANVALVDLGGPAAAPGAFDLVVANSVVQYMSETELSGWMARWRDLLVPGGRIVLSDVPRPGASSPRELLGMLRFAARHRFLLRALRDGVAEAARYSRSRADADLLRYRPDELIAVAARQGLRGQVLPVNLTHRSGRTSVVLEPVDDP